MSLFNDDYPLIWRLSSNALVNAFLGFVIGYFFVGGAIFTVTYLVAFLLLIALFDTQGRELDVIFVWRAMASLVILLMVMWVTAMSVNGWWHLLIPESILRK